MPFSTPSRPAASIAAKARYVFDDGSGQRTSTRVASMLAAGRDLRHADERRAVRPAPGQVGRGLVAGHEPLVRVHERRQDRDHAARVGQDAGHVGLRASSDRPYLLSGSAKAFARRSID